MIQKMTSIQFSIVLFTSKPIFCLENKNRSSFFSSVDDAQRMSLIITEETFKLVSYWGKNWGGGFFFCCLVHNVLDILYIYFKKAKLLHTCRSAGDHGLTQQNTLCNQRNWIMMFQYTDIHQVIAWWRGQCAMFAHANAMFSFRRRLSFNI